MRYDTHGSARDKLLDAAATLFYEQGYQATTIDHIVGRSRVARPTLYAHFETKEELGRAYLQLRRQEDTQAIKDTIRLEKTPEGRFMAVISYVGKTLVNSNYRGCRFFNVIAELQTASHPLVKEARLYVESFREIIRDVVHELKATSKRYKALDVERATDTYYLLVCGAIMASQEYQDPWPIERAKREIEGLLRR